MTVLCHCILNGASTGGIGHDYSSLKRLSGDARNFRAVNLDFLSRHKPTPAEKDGNLRVMLKEGGKAETMGIKHKFIMTQEKGGKKIGTNY